MIKVFTIIFTIIFITIPAKATLIADYHFDACSWDGSTSEVVENINAYHGTAKNGAFTDKGVINFSANLITDNYIQLESNIPVSGDYTISAWVKFPLDFSKHTSYDGTYFFTIADRPGGDYDFLYLRYNTDDGWQWKVQDDSGYGGNTLPTLSDGWHLLTFTASSGTTTLYIDSVEENSIDKHSKGEISLIGTADYNDDLAGQTLGAPLDEFKVFDTALSLTEIQTIFNNEKNEKNYDGSSRTPPICAITTTPYAEYRLDACSWTETIGEVKENIHNYTGTAYSVQPSKEALLVHSADFSANTTTDYLSLDAQALNGLNAFTLSTWIKTSTGDYQTILSGAHSGGTAEDANEVLLWLRDSGKIEFFIKGVRSGTLTIPNIQDNKWHHIIWSREDKHVILYIDGNKELDAYYSDDATLGTVTIDTNGLVIGQDQDSVGGDFDQNFLGKIDEMKIFDKILTPTEVQIIYKNDQVSRNYDGTVREIPSCSVVANYYFDSCEWDGTPREVMDHIDLHDASITANDVNLTSGKLNSAASFPNENNITDIHAIETGITPMDIGNQGSISFWFQSHSAWDSGEGRTLIDASKGDKYFFISLLSDGKIKFYLEDSADHHLQIESNDNFSFAADTWVHLTVSWSLGNNYSLYVNGQKRTINTTLNILDGTAFGGLDTIHLGDIILDYASTGRENGANGVFDEVKIFNTSLTDLQVQALYENENSTKNYDGTTRDSLDCSLPAPRANYYLDNCTIGDTIADMSGNDFNLTVIDGVISSDGKINNAADFNGSNYLDGGKILDDVFGTSNDTFTITAWIKPRNLTDDTTNHGIKNTFFAKASDGDNDNIELGVDPDGSLYVYVDTKGVDGSKSSKYNGFKIGSGIDIDRWHFISIRLYNDTIKVSIDDNITANTTELEGGGNIDKAPNSPVTIGSSQHIDNYFDGEIDEVKVFHKYLTNAQILDIYTNESLHKNYDGSHRMAIDCTTPILLAEYRFDECKYTGATEEVIDSEGGDNSGTIPDFNDTKISTIKDSTRETGRVLKLNEGAIHIDNLAVSTTPYKKNTVMFWMYWDGTTKTMPFGWYIYDLWITSDYFGFNASDSLIYGVNNSTISNGWHHIAAIFTNGDIESNRLYIDGVLQAIEQKQGTINNNNAYATPNATISGWRRNSSFRFSGYLDEFKIYRGEIDQVTIEADYNSAIARDILCSKAIFNAVDQAGGCFNWENNITTKVAGGDIALTILSADQNDNNNSLPDSNITKLELLNFSDSSCSTLNSVQEVWSGNEAVDSDGCYILPNPFTYLKATKCAKMRISGIYEGENVESNSSDTFAIRPDRFILTNLPAGKLTAEHNYTIQAKAVLPDGTTTVADYNTSITPTHQKYFRDGSDGSAMDGTFIPTIDFAFSDGLSTDTTLNFNNVGIVGVELNDTTWAAVDSDDTPLKERTIYLEQNLSFIPSRFQIDFPNTPTMSNYHDNPFTYYANDLNHMGASLKNLSFTITALGENGGVMSNYQNPQTTYFANNSNFSLGVQVDKNPILSRDINESGNRDLAFDAGIATLNYADINFNFRRERNVTKNPLLLEGANSDINITIADSIDTTVGGARDIPFAGSSLFYYGKLKTTDIQTSSSPETGKLEINVYWDGSGTRLFPATFKQQTASWYQNGDDDAISILSDSNFSAMTSRKIDTATSGTTLTVHTPNPIDGEIALQIAKDDTSHAQRAFYHIDIPTWLWYSPYEDYDFSTATTCGQHPCFEYIFNTPESTIGILSGTKNGSHFNNDFNTTKRKAIKVLR